MESELEKVEKRAASELNSKAIPAVKQLFEQARQHWRQYRQLHCDAIDKLDSDGSMAATHRFVCRYQLSKNRKDDLQQSIIEWAER
jgi:uncharacterized protein YecT (DUF1311 family)